MTMTLHLQFQFALGQRVRWAGDPSQRYWIHQRRWTERDLLGPVVEYAVRRQEYHGRCVGWVYEADLTPWQEAQPHRP